MINACYPTPFFLPYASLASPVVCATDDPSGRGRCGIGIECGTGGTAVLRPRGVSGAGSDRAMTLVAGKRYDVEFDQVVSGTATDVIVYWNRI